MKLMIGYVKATIHRVYAPPDDQLTYERLGCIYFCNVGVRLCLGGVDGRIITT
jgi:isopenicillin N synthase-like dioxygenase